MEKRTFLDDDFEFVAQELELIKDEEIPEQSFWKDAWRRFCENKGALIGLIFIMLIIALAIFVPMISSWGFDDINTKIANTKPNGIHWFGTDNYGRDLFVRTFQGARISLFVAVAAVLIDLFVGIFYGLISGYFGGKVDSIMQRGLEIINSIPTLVVLIILMMMLKASLLTIIIALMFTEWIGMARLTRAQVLKIKEEEFVLASRTMGAGHMFIIFKEILPNIFGQLIIMFMMSVPNAIFYEAYLAFVGLGVPKPNASLGTLINDGFNYFLVYPFMMIIPAIILAILMLSFNLFGDGLHDALDPTMKEM